MELEALRWLSDANLAESNREHARFLPPTEVVERGELLFTASGTRCPGGPWNSMIAIGRTAPDHEGALDAARAFYAERGRGFTIYTREHVDGGLAGACERAGYAKLGDNPCMVLLEPVAEKATADSVVLRTVDSVARARDFVVVSAAAYETIGMPAPVTVKAFSMPERWLVPHLHAEVLYDHDEPVAAAMLLFTHGIAGVYWVGTVPKARGRGHADAVMRRVSKVAFDRGARFVTLQATQFGEPVYRRIGYREVTRYPWYLAAATVSSREPESRA